MIDRISHNNKWAPLDTTPLNKGKKKKAKAAEKHKQTVAEVKKYGKEHGLPERVQTKMVGSKYLRDARQKELAKKAKRTRAKQDASRGKQYSK